MSTTTFTPANQDIGDETAVRSPSAESGIEYKNDNIIYSRLGHIKLMWRKVMEANGLLGEQNDDEVTPDIEQQNFEDMFGTILDYLLSIPDEDLTTKQRQELNDLLNLLTNLFGEGEDMTERKLSRGASPGQRQYSRTYYRRNKDRIKKRREQLAKNRKSTDKIKSDKNKDKKRYRNTMGTEAKRKEKSQKRKNENRSFYDFVNNKILNQKEIW
ncbi:MAG: hypothetical protein ACOWWR_13635 [Eubacteriales bacterium]